VNEKGEIDMKTVINAFLVATALFALHGCSTGALNKQVDIDLTRENAVKTRNDLRAESRQVIESAPGLTDDQRSRLAILWTATRAQDDEMRSKSLKLRAMLIKEIVAESYDSDKIELIEHRVKALEDKRVSLAFESVEQAKKIMGREAVVNRAVMDEFLEARGAGHD
jgi:trehalose-6-phosphatase